MLNVNEDKWCSRKNNISHAVNATGTRDIEAQHKKEPYFIDQDMHCLAPNITEDKRLEERDETQRNHIELESFPVNSDQYNDLERYAKENASKSMAYSSNGILSRNTNWRSRDHHSHGKDQTSTGWSCASPGCELENERHLDHSLRDATTNINEPSFTASLHPQQPSTHCDVPLFNETIYDSSPQPHNTRVRMKYRDTTPAEEGKGTLHYVAEEMDSSGYNDQDGGLEKFRPRVTWLVVLLIIQSFISVVLQRFQDIVQHHPIVLYYLTMLVGAGGNAGSQSAVLVIRSLALGTCKRKHYLGVILEQIRTSFFLAIVLTVITFFRLYLFEGSVFEIIAVSSSMMAIVIVSVFIGTVTPLLFKMLKIDPAHAQAAIQVFMDLIGVCITCVTAYFILDYLAPLMGNQMEQQQQPEP